MTYYSHKSYYYGHHSKYGGYSHSNYTTYEFTAFTGNDLFSGGKAQCGLTFDMEAVASTCISVSDDDSKLSGDCRDNATDSTGQKAGITDANGNEMGNGGQIYAEKYFWVTDENGFKYVLIEIEQEGSGAKFYTFHSAYGVPPQGAELTVGSSCNVEGDWLKYDHLGAGPCELPTGSITGTAWCDLDCDGIQDEEVTYTKGDPIFTHSVTYESVTCTTYNVDCYGDWYSTGCDTIDLVVGSSEGHNGNAHDNTIVELDKGGVWSRDFCVDAGGTYCLSFDTYKNFCVDDAGNKFDVKINGHVVESVTVSADGSIELSVELKAGYNEIEFVSKSCYGGTGAGIDNVNFAPLIETSAPSEPTKAGLTVKLLYTDGSPVLDDNGVAITTVTDADGNYRFDDVPVGDYKIMGIAPDGTEFTIQDAGSDDSVDSDVNGDGMSGVITVVADEEVDVDLGLCEKPEPGSLSGRYFCDVNRDGIDNDEPGEAGVTVILLDANGDPATDIDGNPVAAVLTAADGSYSFDNLAAGSYKVQFVDTVTGKVLTDKDVGNDDAVDSDADDLGNNTYEIADIVVVAGEETTDNDAGVKAQPGALSGRYFCDVNRDDIDNDEPGEQGVLVELLDANGDPATDIDGNPVASTLTAADGSYSFANLAEGTYQVRFTDTVTGKTLVAANAGSDDTVDSDAIDQGNGVSLIDGIVVVAGEETKDNDAGVEAVPGSLSGRYFCDVNRDDIDNDEPGEQGVLVELLDANGDPATDIDGNPVASTLTAADGSYSFANLAAGSYQVRFTDTVTGKTLVAANAGSDDTVDSDAIDQGNGVSLIDGIVVVSGQDTADNDAGVFTPNKDPIAVDDEGMGCADETIAIDLISNDSDPDGDAIAVTAIFDADETAGVGGSITLADGAVVTLNADGTVTVDGVAAYADLLIGEEAFDSFSYTVTDANGATAEADVDVKFCGALNTLETIDASLAGAEVTFELLTVTVSEFIDAYKIDLISSTTPDIDLGVYTRAYCLDAVAPIDYSILTTADVLVATQANVDAVTGGSVNSANINAVNWLLNNDMTLVGNGDAVETNYTDLEVQEAIWVLMNDDTFVINEGFGAALNDDQNGIRDGVESATLENVQEIADMAIANGATFVAGAGDIVGLILDPTDPVSQEQPFIIGVAFDSLAQDCLC